MPRTIEKNDLFLWNIFIVLSYTLLCIKMRTTVSTWKVFFFLLLKRAVLLYNSNNILETPLGIALRVGNRFKCLWIFSVISEFWSLGRMYLIFQNSIKVIGSNIQWIGWVIKPSKNSLVFRWAICLNPSFTYSVIGTFHLNNQCFGSFTSKNEDGNIVSACLPWWLLIEHVCTLKV